MGYLEYSWKSRWYFCASSSAEEVALPDVVTCQHNEYHWFHLWEERVRVSSGNLLEFIDACLDSTPSLIAKVYSDKSAWTRQMKVLKFHCHAYGGCAECGIQQSWYKMKRLDGFCWNCYKQTSCFIYFFLWNYALIDCLPPMPLWQESVSNKGIDYNQLYFVTLVIK